MVVSKSLMIIYIYIYTCPGILSADVFSIPGSGSPGEALLAALKGAVKSYTSEYPKDKMWANHLNRLYDAEATMKDL